MPKKRDRRAEFGRRLKKLRVERALSQEKLTELAGLDKNYVTEAERGKSNPSLETIGKLADVLGVDDAALVSDFTPEDKTC
jgi:transcriptional regulator with XRE-family HTH domain